MAGAESSFAVAGIASRTFSPTWGRVLTDLTLDRINNEGDYEPGNCRWTTWEQQVLNRRTYRGERHPNAKLTADDVLPIRRMASYGVTYRSIASAFGVSHANVGYIVRGEAWQELFLDQAMESRRGNAGLRLSTARGIGTRGLRTALASAVR